MPEGNTTLRRLMRQNGFTREALAELVNVETERLTGEPGRCSPRLVGLWLNGSVTWPRSHSRTSLERVFALPAAEIGFIPPPGSAHHSTTPHIPTPRSVRPTVERRTFLLGLGTTLALPALPESGRIGAAEVHRIEHASTLLHRLDDRHGGAAVSEVAARYIDDVEEAVRRCSCGPHAQVRLYRALGGMATSAGWFAFDAEHQRAARSHWNAALRYAVLAKDRILQARVWSSMSHQANHLSHGQEAVSIARIALDQTRGRRDGRLSSLLHTRVAQGHALQGDSGLCSRSLLLAEQEFDRPAENTPNWLGFYHEGEVAAAASLSFRQLGRGAEAVEAARGSIDHTRRTPYLRNSLASRARLANALAVSGELEEAVVIGSDALREAPGVRSPRILSSLAALRDKAAHAGVADLEEFDSLCNAGNNKGKDEHS